MAKTYQNWEFQDVTKNGGFTSPWNSKTPYVGSQFSQITFCVLWSFFTIFDIEKFTILAML